MLSHPSRRHLVCHHSIHLHYHRGLHLCKRQHLLRGQPPRSHQTEQRSPITAMLSHPSRRHLVCHHSMHLRYHQGLHPYKPQHLLRRQPPGSHQTEQLSPSMAMLSHPLRRHLGGHHLMHLQYHRGLHLCKRQHLLRRQRPRSHQTEQLSSIMAMLSHPSRRHLVCRHSMHLQYHRGLHLCKRQHLLRGQPPRSHQTDQRSPIMAMLSHPSRRHLVCHPRPCHPDQHRDLRRHLHPRQVLFLHRRRRSRVELAL
mmetsp:Transcript_20532/g.71050  ORF Transcript_20532/g.71050 Transcript_20532/m.71050 type:complete len:254 (-) Transcript_20532:378-1139(-)